MMIARPASILLFLTVLVQSQFVSAAEVSTSDPDTGQSALQSSIEQQQEVSRYRDRIAELESEYGGFDRRLLESLQGLTTALIAAGELDEADRVLQRQLHLLRTLDGPSNPDQLPTVAELINNDIRRQDWKNVAERFEYIYWLRGQDVDAAPEALLNARDDLAAWHLAAIYVGNPRIRFRNFQKARQWQRENLFFAEDSFAEDSPELIPWLYKHAITQYQVYAMLTADDELGFDARSEIMRIEGWPLKSYLREGLNTVKRIRNIVAAHSDTEAEAMAMIYEADYQMLLELGTSAKLYRRAMEKLKESGKTEDQVEAFFQRPVVLPVEQMYFSLDEALEEQAGYNYKSEPVENGDGDSIHMGDFIAWNESLPFLRRPGMPQLASSVKTPLNEVELVFSISSRGKSRNPKVLQSEPDKVRVKRDARDAIKAMQFRPRFVHGKWQRINDVKIRYLYPPRQ
ncbi:MAG: hypothetical protein JKY98_00175 [Gammaproteobacteria bacterium]|nr:hypothetical protein [Gammaproteobacteria bacterium]